jgi:uncharacterized membrane protein
MKEDYGAGDKGLDRVLALSDAIFAFSLTLLALNLIVPQILSNQPNTELQNKLAEMIPSFIIFFWSFFIVSLYWIGHHRVFRHIKRYDGILMWCNLLLLMFITLIPFVSNLNIQYGNLQITVVLSAIFYSIPGLAMSVLWTHASRRYLLIDKNLSKHIIILTRNRNIVAPFIFLISIPLSYIHPYVTIFFWLTLIPLRIFIERLSKQ